MKFCNCLRPRCAVRKALTSVNCVPSDMTHDKVIDEWYTSNYTCIRSSNSSMLSQLTCQPNSHPNSTLNDVYVQHYFTYLFDDVRFGSEIPTPPTVHEMHRVPGDSVFLPIPSYCNYGNENPIMVRFWSPIHALYAAHAETNKFVKYMLDWNVLYTPTLSYLLSNSPTHISTSIESPMQ